MYVIYPVYILIYLAYVCISIYIYMRSAWSADGSSFEAFGCSTGWDEMCCIGEAMLAHAVALASAWILLCNRCDLPQMPRRTEAPRGNAGASFLMQAGNYYGFWWVFHGDRTTTNRIKSKHVFATVTAWALSYREGERGDIEMLRSQNCQRVRQGWRKEE